MSVQRAPLTTSWKCSGRPRSRPFNSRPAESRAGARSISNTLVVVSASSASATGAPFKTALTAYVSSSCVCAFGATSSAGRSGSMGGGSAHAHRTIGAAAQKRQKNRFTGSVSINAILAPRRFRHGSVGFSGRRARGLHLFEGAAAQAVDHRFAGRASIGAGENVYAAQAKVWQGCTSRRRRPKSQRGGVEAHGRNRLASDGIGGRMLVVEHRQFERLAGRKRRVGDHVGEFARDIEVTASVVADVEYQVGDVQCLQLCYRVEQRVLGSCVV